MATDPRIPDSLDPRGKGHTGGLKPEPPTSGRAGLILALITAALILGAILYFMPRAPKVSPAPTAAEVPNGPAAGMLQLTNPKMTTSPNGGSMYIQAMVQNTSPQTINGIVAQVRFRTQDGSVAQAVNVPVQLLQQEGGARVGQPLTNAPMKPNDTRPVRIAVDRVPQNWDHQMPEIQVSAVTSHS
jgi:hypothetical protein